MLGTFPVAQTTGNFALVVTLPVPRGQLCLPSRSGGFSGSWKFIVQILSSPGIHWQTLFTGLLTLTLPLYVTSDPAVRGNIPIHSIISAVHVVIIYLLEGGVLWWLPIQCLDRVRKVLFPSVAKEGGTLVLYVQRPSCDNESLKDFCKAHSVPFAFAVK